MPPFTGVFLIWTHLQVASIYRYIEYYYLINEPLYVGFSLLTNTKAPQVVKTPSILFSLSLSLPLKLFSYIFTISLDTLHPCQKRKISPLKLEFCRILFFPQKSLHFVVSLSVFLLNYFPLKSLLSFFAISLDTLRPCQKRKILPLKSEFYRILLFPQKSLHFVVSLSVFLLNFFPLKSLRSLFFY